MKPGLAPRILGILVGSLAVVSSHETSAQEHGWSVIAPILDKHCAKCHQDGKTTGKFKDRPAGKFGFVLDENEMIKHNKLIPGNADGSQIFSVIVKGDMPKNIDDACLDGSASADTYCGLSDAEKTALHDEINRLAAPPKAPQVVVADAVLTKPDAVAPGNADTKSVDTKSVDTKPVDIKSVDIKSVDTKPADTKPVDTKSVDIKPVDIKPVEVAPKSEPVVKVASPTFAPGPVQIAERSEPAAPPAAPPFITDRQIIRAISEDVSSAPPGDGSFYRYLTLTHLVNAGDPEKDLRVYRLALTKLLNSLSTSSDPYVPVPIDSAKSIFRIDIRRLGWTAHTWDAIVATDPYVVFYADAQFKALQRDLYTVAPFVKADWFTFNTARPPLYNQILGLPRTRAELQAKLGMDVHRDFDERRVERAGFQQSGVSSNNRLIERHAISTGAYWESYDFGSNEERKSLFQFPVGPQGAFQEASAHFGFKQDGGEIIFNLPNGFQAYYLTDGNGNQLDIGPTKIVRDPSQRDLSVTNGIACMGCHDKGMKSNDFRPGKPLDQVRDVVMRSGTFPSEVKDIVKATFPTGEAFQKRLDSDARHFAAALDAAGINVNTRLDGVEIINALSKRFEENLNARLAAAEVGMTEDMFMERLNAAGQQAYDLKLRLQQDLVPRDQFVALFAPLVNTISDEGDKAIDLSKVAQKAGTTVTAIAGEGHHSPQTSKTFDLAFYANATRYRVGDKVTFTLRSEQPCFLKLTDTDDHGQSIVLFPNSSHTDARIEAHQTIEIPGPLVTGFVIASTEPGHERIVATCNASFQDIPSQDLHNQQFKTFASTRAVIATASTAQKDFSKRILSLIPTASHDPTAPVVTASEGNATHDQLVANPIEPTVAIVATKSIVLNITAH